MHLIIDGYNLLHVGRSPIQMSPIELQRERDQLINQLSGYRRIKQWDITVVFDGWQGGWSTEKQEKKRGIDLIFSKLGEKADEVIKRLVKEKGSGAVIVTSDREISRYAERLSASVIPSDKFREKMEGATFKMEKRIEEDEAEGSGIKRKGPSRRLSKKEKRKQAALRKL
jgi:predicted RNA-binding protein with PIN domain